MTYVQQLGNHDQAWWMCSVVYLVIVFATFIGIVHALPHLSLWLRRTPSGTKNPDCESFTTVTTVVFLVIAALFFFPLCNHVANLIAKDPRPEMNRRRYEDGLREQKVLDEKSKRATDAHNEKLKNQLRDAAEEVKKDQQLRVLPADYKSRWAEGK